MKILRRLYSDWVIGLLITLPLLAGFLFEWTPLRSLEYKTYDFRAKLKQRKVSNSPVVIVAIDDSSIATLGRWPWPRSYMADMVSLLGEFGAGAIGVNVLYSEPDQNTGLSEVRNIKKTIEGMADFEKNRQLLEIYESLISTEENLDNDGMFSWAIKSSGKVVLPVVFTLGEDIGKGEEGLPEYLNANSLESPGGAVTAVSITPPIPAFASAAKGLGHVNLVEDEDGTVREEPLLIRHKGRLFPSFSLQLALGRLGYGVQDITVSNGIKAGNMSIPLDDGNILISYNGKQATFPYYSFYDVATNKVPPDVFKDKIVLIGHTGTGNVTLRVTPVEHAFPAVEIEANVIENILNKNFISRPGWARPLELGTLIFFGIFISLLMPRFKAGMSALITALLLVLWNGAAVYLFVSKGFRLQMFMPTLLLGLGYTLMISKRYLITEKAKDVVEADSIETNKMLGLSFQGQGMLDMAFEKLRKCPVEDETVKDLLYNLALDFERKRQFNKAAAVYEHIFKAGKYKDIEDRIKQLKAAGETMIFGTSQSKKDATVIVQGGASATPTLGRYEVQKELGRGAMGTVYLGKDPKINRMVAIKTVRFDEIEEDQADEVKKRFFREAEAAGTLSHPNIVTIFDAGEDYDVGYVAMELLDGVDLVMFCSKENKMPLKKVLWAIGSVAGALDYAHKHGIVHRDIKPANIMLLKKNIVKVTDFGIARVVATSKTQTGVILGTPSYMSPEQVMGKKVDGRSDLFSLGVVFYEMLTCEKPFTGDSIGTLMYNIANQPYPPLKEKIPELPDCCVAIIDKMLAKEADQRYQRGGEIVRDIKACMQGIA